LLFPTLVYSNISLLNELSLGNKQWVWLALDAKTREIVGFHVGDRSETGAKAL
jgi:IS1 family transposase